MRLIYAKDVLERVRDLLACADALGRETLSIVLTKVEAANAARAVGVPLDRVLDGKCQLYGFNVVVEG